mmetsp:Transcript_30852/g.57541  ORF Transcript_30852/g.57541 Transcript_30852/m.57541 type:complete len:206 (+) Transcript_30852:82-699(+)
MSNIFTAGHQMFEIRSFDANVDNLDQYRDLFLRCDNVVVAGIEQNDDDLRRVGEEYVANACQSDLASWASVSEVYQHGCGDFWLLVLVDSTSLQEASDSSGWNTPSTIVGSIAMEDKGNGVFELRRLCVSDAYRRMGLGMKLLQHLVSHAEASGQLRRLYFSTPSINTSAISMYLKGGFVFEKEMVCTFEPKNTQLAISTFSYVL